MVKIIITEEQFKNVFEYIDLNHQTGLIGEDNNSTITFYHKIMDRNDMGIEKLIKSVFAKGLIPNDNGEIGNVIWFSNDYEDYGKEGKFVVSITIPKNQMGFGKNPFDFTFDGHNAYAHKPIPFNNLKIIKIPIMYNINSGHTVSNDFFINFYKNRSFLESINKNQHKIVLFGDLFNKYVQPYLSEKNVIQQINNPNINIKNVI